MKTTTDLVPPVRAAAGQQDPVIVEHGRDRNRSAAHQIPDNWAKFEQQREAQRIESNVELHGAAGD